MKFALQSAVLLLATGFVFIFQQSGLKDATPPVIAFFVIIYLLLSFVRNQSRKHMETKSGNTTDAVNIIKDDTTTTALLFVVVLLLMYVTGGFNSILFFLLYFLSFSIAFTLQPETVFVFLIAVLILYLPQIGQGNMTVNLVKMGSLFLLSPLAYFFGKEFREHTRERRKIEKLTEGAESIGKQIDKDVSDIITHNKGDLDDEEVARLKDIVDETKELEETISK